MDTVRPLPSHGSTSNRKSSIQVRLPRQPPRVVLSTLLLIVATSVRADWVKVGEDDGAVIYVDPATVEKAGDVRRAWSLSNMRLPRGDDVASFRTLDDFNCKEGRRRTVFRVTYSGPMATGKVLDSGKPMLFRFENVYPYTPAGWQFEYVCRQ